MRHGTLALFITLVVLAAFVASCSTSADTLILATTTSTADSGMLDDILPQFEEEAGIKVKVLAVGTGEALELGKRGDADVVLVHDRKREDEFMSEGFGVIRKDVMYNDFVLVGPADDPAGTSEATGAVGAFARIADAGGEERASFVSRGDSSGTHFKEKGIWALAGTEPDGGWYKSTGQGMGETLIVAHELGAYTLADRGTYLALAERLELVVLVENDELLFNSYGVMAVSAKRFPDVNLDLAERLIEFLVHPDTQRRIGEFGTEEFGQPLFHPNAVP